MGSRQKATVDINPDAIMQALKEADYTAASASRIIGMADNYISSLCRYGAGNADVVARLANLCRVDYEALLKKNPATEDPEPAKLPEVGGQTVARIYEQQVKTNTRLDDIEKELRRLQSIELRQERTMNQVAAIVEVLTRWSDQITKITNQTTGCNTNLLRLLALLEGRKQK